MRVLILGGTVFIGRHLVDAARARGHEVTLFNRGREPAVGLGDVERLVGDRRGDLSALQGRTWDAAIDAAAYVPSWVERSARALAGSVAHYTFVSTVSVYASPLPNGVDESSPVATIDDEAIRAAEAIVTEGRAHARLYGRSYGGLKILCERAAESAMPGRVLVVRPGLVAGPYDSTDRFTYWVRRLTEPGPILAPGKPERPVRFIDARDLAGFIVRSAEAKLAGTFNASGPDGLTMGGVLDACARAADVKPELVWVPDETLVRENVAMWSELPLWVTEEHQGFATISCARAIAAGLTFQSLFDTCKATLAWDRARGPVALEAGLDRAREIEILGRHATPGL